MTTQQIQQVFELCIVPLLGVITTYIVKLIQKKNKEIDAHLNDEQLCKYNDALAKIIQDAVISTNQTYVDALKGKNAFDKDAQRKAFALTQEKVKSLLTEEAQDVLAEAYGDLTLYITTRIEAEVNTYKAPVASSADKGDM